uniref:Uncharacterized protein n=1 Tax=Anguilla anguilla TaxID=7936 RepID=A0A0E9WGA2_ANGAN
MASVYSLLESQPSHSIAVGRFCTWVGVSTLPSSSISREPYFTTRGCAGFSSTSLRANSPFH